MVERGGGRLSDGKVEYEQIFRRIRHLIDSLYLCLIIQSEEAFAGHCIIHISRHLEVGRHFKAP